MKQDISVSAKLGDNNKYELSRSQILQNSHFNLYFLLYGIKKDMNPLKFIS